MLLSFGKSCAFWGTNIEILLIWLWLNTRVSLYVRVWPLMVSSLHTGWQAIHVDILHILVNAVSPVRHHTQELWIILILRSLGLPPCHDASSCSVFTVPSNRSNLYICISYIFVFLFSYSFLFTSKLVF